MPATGVITDGLPGKEYLGKFTTYVLITSIVAGMGGLTFGYDSGISGGVTSMDSFLLRFFPSVYRSKNLDESMNEYCQYNNQMLTMFASSLYLAALLSCVVASTVTRKFGRGFSIFVGGGLFCLGAFLNAGAQATWYLTVGRIRHRIQESVRTTLPPGDGSIQVERIAERCFQLFITVGILIANVTNYFFARIEEGWGWKLSLGLAAVPGLIITVGGWLLPDTPNSMIERGEREEARARLKRIRGVQDVEEEYNDLVRTNEASKQVEHPWLNLPKRKHRPQLIIALLMPAFQQLTGINVVMFYAPLLFNSIVFGNNASLTLATQQLLLVWSM